MVPKTLLLLASLMGAALAAPAPPIPGRPSKPCKPSASTSSALAPASTTTAAASASSVVAVVSSGSSAVVTPTTVADPAVTPTLPSTGATDLPNPPAGAVLKAIAVGHGLQNYTCVNATGTAAQAGALAVLYDITSLYPGTVGTGLSEAGFSGLSSTVLNSQDIPLNLQDPSAASPATPALPEASYGAVVASPFIAPADLALANMDPIAFLGHHYFDAGGSPTFDLTAAGLFFSGAKAGGVKAPADADKGLLATGAVDWLQLGDSGKGLSSGVTYAYRVVTAGGVAQTCDVSGAGAGSVPYTAQYWFFGN